MSRASALFVTAALACAAAHSAGHQAWHDVEHFRIGAADGAEELLFGTLIRTALSPAGHIVVLDPQSAEVRVFDGRGGFIRSFGRRGEGPGELLNPTAIAWDGEGRLWIANAFNGRYTVFDSIGEPIRTVPRPLLGFPGRHRLVFLDHGSFVDVGAAAARRVPIVIVDTTGAIRDSAAIQLPQTGVTGQPLPQGFDGRVLAYLPSLVWTIAPDGTVWLADSDRLRLINRSIRGDTLRVIEAAHRRGLALDRATRQRIEREFAKLQGPPPSELVRPIIRSVEILTDGHVLVEIIEEVGRPSDLFDIFDPEGRYLGELRLGFPLARAGVSSFVGDTIIGVTTGELDVPYVVRAEIQRR